MDDAIPFIILAAGGISVAVLLLLGRKRYKIELRATQTRQAVCNKVANVKKSSLADYKATAQRESAAFTNAQEPEISAVALKDDALEREHRYLEEIALYERKRIPEQMQVLSKHVEEIGDFTQGLCEIITSDTILKSVPKKEKPPLKTIRRRGIPHLIEAQMILDVISDLQDPLAIFVWQLRSSALDNNRDSVTAMDLFCNVIRDEITVQGSVLWKRVNQIIEETETCHKKLQALIAERNEYEKELYELQDFVRKDNNFRTYLGKLTEELDKLDWRNNL